MRTTRLQDVLKVAQRLREMRTRSGFLCLVGTVLSTALYFPALKTPLVADDYISPFTQIRVSGTGLFGSLTDAWGMVFDGISFRLSGVPVGALFNWIWLQLAGQWGVELLITYALTKWLVFTLTCIAAAFLAQQTLFSDQPDFSFGMIFMPVAVALGATAQIHGIWSNDPVASYPLSGYGSVAISLFFMGWTARFLHDEKPKSLLIATALGVLAVSYYEMSIGAVMGAAVMILFRFWPFGTRPQNTRRQFLVSTTTLVLIPAIYVLWGRSVTGSRSHHYGGTTVRMGRQAVDTFVAGGVSNLPASAWWLSRRHLGGVIPVSFSGAAVAAVVTLLTLSLLSLSLRNLTRPTLDKYLLLVVPMTVYALFALAIQSITEKVQNETLGIGYVYTQYAVGSSVVAVLLAICVMTALKSRYASGIRSCLLVGCSLFIAIQFTTNWSLSNQMTRMVQPNSELTRAFSETKTEAERCAALINWTNGNWPEYYERDMVEGLEIAYRHFHSTSFCSSFVYPD
jgi:hypothetical protein